LYLPLYHWLGRRGKNQALGSYKAGSFTEYIKKSPEKEKKDRFDLQTKQFVASKKLEDVEEARSHVFSTTFTFPHLALAPTFRSMMRAAPSLFRHSKKGLNVRFVFNGEMALPS
jgi:hypothetical protein